MTFFLTQWSRGYSNPLEALLYTTKKIHPRFIKLTTSTWFLLRAEALFTGLDRTEISVRDLQLSTVSITEIVSLACLFILFLMMFFVVKNHFVLMQLWQQRAERDGAMMDFLCFVCFVCFTVYLLPRLM